MSIIFNKINFSINGSSSFGNRDAFLPENKCCRCGHTAWDKEGEYNCEYNIQSYIWYQSLDKKYLCLSCVDKINSPIRKCIHCNKQFMTGKEIITHLKLSHSK